MNVKQSIGHHLRDVLSVSTFTDHDQLEFCLSNLEF